MGNKNNQMRNQNRNIPLQNLLNEVNNNNEVKIKDAISKGTYKEKYNIKESDPRELYDLIININTFSQIPNIKWLIETKDDLLNIQEPEKDEKNKIDNININNNNNNIDIQNEDNIIENEDEKIEVEEKNFDIDIDKTNNSVIGILGLSNVGKSYLLSLFTGQELPTGDSIHTKGISVKKIKNFIILDSEGIDAALTKENIAKELYPKENLLNKNINESDSLIEQIARDKKAVELFIQDFIIEKSDIIVIVVGPLTLQEQKMINQIVTTTKKETIYIIHNLKNFYSKEQIQDYIENTFKQNIFFKQGQKITEQFYKPKKDLKDKEEEYNQYFLEKYNDSRIVLHFIMGSNIKESHNYCFNKTVIDFFKNEISSIRRKEFDLFKEIRDFLVEKGENYIESSEAGKKPFTAENIKFISKGKLKYISIKNENNKIKKCIMNQLGFSHFYGTLYTPNYICYEETDEETKEKKLIIDINAPGNGFKFDPPKREEIFEEGHKIILSFTGTRELNDYNDIEIVDSNVGSGNFRIDIYLDCDKIHLKENENPHKKKLKGVMRYTYSLVEEQNLNNEK